ncbi:hypothetical protein IW140_001026 [Coemansia sp. RSA 1813]|nr:hypothetical protein EV178_004236 [Coemansia sp. RSA 1646]KAJ1770765.1 hypothetical protein LPJ74_002896 [Coemansia sp. RSA 1843]KAJ2091522.1 hypothetical protein IW138_001750 [Coemansia sp. RSA 986]KAJ2215177.1 hypothetical protein EV179_002396 [Coemansia sp. RSA 487]KAJ2572277.1 hypothetical protein IW140_001026 [Coemansia sp. RSA 1813]
MSDPNTAELESLRRQLQQLHESFSAVIEETRPTPDNIAIMPWPDLLSKFNVLAAKYTVLSQAVSSKHAHMLKEMAVAPRTRPGNIHEQNILSVLLRTKLAPEIEKEEETIWAQVQAEMLRDKNLDWFARAEKQESLAITAVNSFMELKGRHAESVGTALETMARKSESSTKGAKEATDQQHQSSAPHNDSSNGTRAEQVSYSPEHKQLALEDILAFTSSGTKT